MDEEKRNTLIFFVLSLIVIVGYPYFFGGMSQNTQEIVSISEATDSVDTLKDKTASHEIFKTPQPQAKVEEVKIQSAKLSGTISSKGLRINDVSLNEYKEKLNESPNIELFNTQNDLNNYAETRWYSEDKTVSVPDANTCWEVGDNKILTEKTPVTFTWDNRQGLLFEKKLTVDENYIITVEDKVRNYSGNSYILKSSVAICREFDKKPEDTSIAYEGPIGFLNGKSEQIKYEDITSKTNISYQTQGGWFGFTDKYWLIAFIPNQQTTNNVSYTSKQNGTLFQITSDDGASPISAYSEVVKINHLYVGAKEINTLDMYEDKLGIKHFDLAIDFGWMYILTKPCLYLLAYAKNVVGNMGLGILLITLLLKLLLFPLANKSYRSMNKMRDFQPKMKELQERYKDDKMKLSQEMAAFYKKEGISPVGGCLPMLLQWPILFALYKVLYISIEMRQASFFGWIHDLSQPDSMYILNLFGLIPINLPSFLQVGIWPILMGITMLVQQKLSPAPADPAQEKMLLLMPIMFTFLFAQMPSGLIIYWTFSNILNIIQQYCLMKIDEKSKDRKRSRHEKIK